MDALDRAALRLRDSSGQDDAHADGSGHSLDDGDQRSAPSDRFDALIRWARRRDESPVPVERQTSGGKNRPETPLERKLALLDQAAARSAEPVERETTDSPRTMTQADFWRRHPDEYIPPGAEVRRPDAPEPFRDPREWVADVNPDARAPGRKNNCGECTRATELSWRGFPAVSAAYGYPERPGEHDERMEEWSRTNLRPQSFDQVEARLTEDGHGASALVAVGWQEDGGGHWFNAVNYHGEVLAVDGQQGTVERWPPTERVSGYDESIVSESLAIHFDSDGRLT